MGCFGIAPAQILGRLFSYPYTLTFSIVITMNCYLRFDDKSAFHSFAKFEKSIESALQVYSLFLCYSLVFYTE